jgi:hypothetical protein
MSDLIGKIKESQDKRKGKCDTIEKIEHYDCGFGHTFEMYLPPHGDWHHRTMLTLSLPPLQQTSYGSPPLQQQQSQPMP